MTGVMQGFQIDRCKYWRSVYDKLFEWVQIIFQGYTLQTLLIIKEGLKNCQIRRVQLHPLHWFLSF